LISGWCGFWRFPSVFLKRLRQLRARCSSIAVGTGTSGE
jgi:hypothetical protein